MDVALIILVAGAGLAAFALRGERRAARSPARALNVVAASHPSATRASDGSLTFAANGLTLNAETTPTGLRLRIYLNPPPLPWRVAARAIGDGPTLALLSEGDVVIEPGGVAVTLPPSALNRRGLRMAVSRIATVVDRLTAIPMAQALARHILDHAPPSERPALFERLTTLFANAHVTEQCALTCAADHEQPTLAAAAAHWLATAPQRTKDEFS